MSHSGIDIILGCMFSGKSTEMIRRYNQYKAINKNILLINHLCDTRYGKNIVSSHNKVKIDCTSCKELLPLIDTELFTASEIIMIEEAQFFPDLYKFCITSADKHHKHVILSGLDGDFKREPFGDILKLIPHSEEVVKLHAMCKQCNDGTFASFTKRITNNKEQCLVGGLDHYIPVCRKHYL